MARTAAAQRRDEGSALAEFVLVGVMLTMLFLAVLQLGLDLHLRNVMAACAADGARYGAFADVRSLPAAESHAVDRLRETVGGGVAAVRTSSRYDDVGGDPVVVVRMQARLPTVFGLLPALPVSVEGRALLEPALR